MKVKEKKGTTPKDYTIDEPVIREFKEIDLSGTYSYANYLKWEFEERVELIKGKIYKMSPAPGPSHQLYSGDIFGELYIYFKDKPCQIFSAPFDVRFPTGSSNHKDILTVVQPDITVICNTAIIDGRGCLGAPDITVEVLSPSTRKKDLKIKHDLYEEFGVKEYWIVDPVKLLFVKYTLKQSGFYDEGKIYHQTDEFTSDLLPGFKLNVYDVFDKPKFKKADALRP